MYKRQTELSSVWAPHCCVQQVSPILVEELPRLTFPEFVTKLTGTPEAERDVTDSDANDDGKAKRKYGKKPTKRKK